MNQILKKTMGVLLLLLLISPGSFAQRYATTLYYTWANHVMPSSLGYGDVKNMLTTPYGTGYNWWGKPLYAATHGDGTVKNNYVMYFGDASNPNRGLLDYHADLLVQGGIDFITIDFSNGDIWDITEGAKALCNRYNERMAAGLPTPKVAFFVKDRVTLQMVQNVIFNNYRADMFFNYLGKKLVMIAQPNENLPLGGASQPPVPTDGIYANYTCRTMWGLFTDARFWSFKTNASTPPGPFMYGGQPEQMSAAFAVQASYMTVDGVNPEPSAQGRQNGTYFSKYMDAAKNAGSKFVFITEWNEWTAINFATPPAAKFTDCWKMEYSSDAEPMEGGHGSFYYDLMKRKVAEYKGTTGVQSAFLGSPVNLPGVVEAENFDNGGEGIAYHDTDGSNLGSVYRPDGVDLQACGEGGYNTGWTSNGEWLEYTVNVTSAGTYRMDARVSSLSGGSFHIEFDGANVTGGTVAVPNTGGWQNWQTVSRNVTLSAGVHVMRYFVDQQAFNVNKFTFTSTATQPASIVPGAVYKIIGKQSGRCIDVAEINPNNNAPIWIWDYLGSANQQWKTEDAGGGFFRLTQCTVQADAWTFQTEHRKMDLE